MTEERLEKARVALEMARELLGELSEEEKVELLLDTIEGLKSGNVARAMIFALESGRG